MPVSPPVGAVPRPLVLAIPGSLRLQRFQQALAEVALPPARVMSWLELLEGYSPARFIREGGLFRVESPGEDFETWRALVAHGDGPLSRLEAFSLEPGSPRVPCGAQWYSGLCAALERLARELKSAPPHRRMNDPDTIALTLHRSSSQQHLAQAGVAVPPTLAAPADFATLAAQLEESPRVFLKPLYGASVGGVMAIERGPSGRHMAWTALALEGGQLCRQRQVRQLRDPRELALVVDALCAGGVHMERWMPKGKLGGKTLDLRVLCIAGEPRHAVVRGGRTPLTSLESGSARRDLGALKRAAGSKGWARVLDLCSRAAAALPESLYVGLDVLLTPDWCRAMVIGADAFGDLLPDARSRGEDPWVAELMVM